MSKAKRRLTNINFEREGSHVALVGKHQGGPANGITTLVTKATNDISEEDVEKVLSSPGESQEGGVNLNEKSEEETMETIEKSVHETLVLKAVEEAVAIVKAELDTTTAELTKAKEKITELETVEKQRKVDARKAKLEAVTSAEDAEKLLKSLELVEDEAFDAVVATLEKAAKTASESDLFKEQGAGGTSDMPVEDATMAIIKQRYAK